MATMSIGAAIHWLAQQAADAPCVTCEGRSITRAQLDARSNRLARAYQALGVEQDDLVTIALPNGIELYEAAIAVWKLGATPQPISAKLPAVERDAIVALARTKIVVGAREIGVAAGAGVRCVPEGFEPDASVSDAPLPDRSAKHWKAPTSGGSTGRPKIIVSGTPGTTDPEAPRMRFVQLVPGPLYHNAPFMFSMQSLYAGGHLIVMKRFDAEEALRLMAEHRVQFAVLVPTMMHRMWRLGPEVRARYDLSALVRILHMAAPCPVWLKEAFIDWLGPERVHELYAGTEAQGGTYINGTDWLQHKGSVGKPMNCDVLILDEQGKALPPRQLGEVFLRSKAEASRRYRYIGANAKVHSDDVHGEGWESLGDMGFVDEDGYLYLGDRQTDMILCGGANIYPAEIESAIDSHPAVRSSCVIGLPDEDLGNVVHAIVDIADHELSDAELKAHLVEQLAKYKLPRSYELVRTPLRDDAGKVRRSALRAERLQARRG